MLNNQNIQLNYPKNYSQKINGKLTYKVKIKDDYVRHNGTSSIYVQVFLNNKKKIFPMNLSVPIKMFDKSRQRVSVKFELHQDYNLIIEKFLSQLNTIEINYRLSNLVLDIERLTNEVLNPTSWICFIKFWTEELERQKEMLKSGTYRQQKSSLSKLKEYKETLYFYEINKQEIDNITRFLRVKKKNELNTVGTFFKNFKKYLNIAGERGINVPMQSKNIKRFNFKSDRAFLMPDEINTLFEYWNSKFINDIHKSVLSRFLFSCFTGLRISDIIQLNIENIIGDYLVFVAQKTNKLQRIKLNKSALQFIGQNVLFEGIHTPEHINRTLKDICKISGIKKRVSFHVSRHTFATNFIIAGGNVTVLQKLLGHSEIKTTMIYVHIAESVTDVEILNMDSILEINS